MSDSYKKYMSLAEDFQLKGKFEDAAKIYQFLISKGVQDSSLFADFGVTQQQLGNLEKAIQFYNKSIKIDFTNSYVHINLATALRSCGHLKEAKTAIDSAIELQPSIDIAYFVLAGILNDLGNTNQAIVSCKKAIEINPENPKFFLFLAYVYLELNKLTDAEDSFLKIVKLQPNFVDGYTNLASIYKQLGNLSKAKVFIQKAYALNPESSQILSNLGSIFRELGQLEESELFTRKAIKLNPNLIGPYLNLARILIEGYQYTESEYFINKAIELNKYCDQAYSVMALNFKQRKRFKIAKKYILKAISINPNSGQNYQNLAEILIDLGEVEQAALAYLNAIKVQPRLTKPYHMLAILNTDLIPKEWVKSLFSEEFLCNQNDINKVDIYFARANVLRNDCNFFESSKMYKLANDLSQKVYSSNYEKTLVLMQKYLRIYRKLPIRDIQYDEEKLRIPIFTVGLPRSGKTLCESILSRNDLLASCGETNSLSRAIDSFLSKKNNEHKKSLNQLYLDNVSQEYLDKKYICSTTPLNYIYTGLILTQLKGSKIIYCYRNPLDHIKEMYFKHFENRHTYTSSIIESANIWIATHTLMKEYKKEFSDHIYFLNYDQLVQDSENTIKSLIEWLGWDFNDKYMSPNFQTSTYMSAKNNNPSINKSFLNSHIHYQDILTPAIDVFKKNNKFRSFVL